MKKIIPFLMLAAAVLSLYKQGNAERSVTNDTTFVTDLNNDGVNETVSLTLPGTSDPQYGFMYNGNFILKVGSQSVNAETEVISGAEISLIDINKADNFKEILIAAEGVNDMVNYYVYRYDGQLKEIGKIEYSFGFEVTGNNSFTAKTWMGFWTAKDNYAFDSSTGRINIIPAEFYEMNENATVVNNFNLLTIRDDKGEVAGTLSPKTKITLIKADLSPKCKTENGDDDYTCDWYYIKAENGREGWARLRDFQDKVEGLKFAG